MHSDKYPPGWQLTRLAALGEVNRGRSRHRPRYAEHLYGGPYPFIQTGDIKNSGGKITRYVQTYSEAGLAQSRLWPAGTMCITIAANIAETAILTFPACFPDSIVGFIADRSKCDVRFVEYVFRYLRNRIQHEASGSVQDNINLETLERLDFAVPRPLEQSRIADILESLDDKIELNRHMNETLEATARTVFKAWFVDCAEHYQLSTLEQEFSLVMGQSPPGESYNEDQQGLPLYQGRTDFGFRYPKPRLYCEEPIRFAERGDTLVSVRAPVGDLNMARERCCIGRGVAALRHKSGSRSYSYYSAHELKAKLQSYEGEGTVFGSIGKDEFRGLNIIAPPEEVIQQFEDAATPIDDLIEKNEQETSTLIDLRNLLLPKLITGEIRITSEDRSDG